MAPMHRAVARGRICIVCERAVRARGLCSMHYEWKRRRESAVLVCLKDECPKKVFRRRMCWKHYMAADRLDRSAVEKRTKDR